MSSSINDRKKEKGIAVLIALGMMALLMVMGMAFAFSARSDLKVSTAYKNINLAQGNAEDSAVNAIHRMHRLHWGTNPLKGMCAEYANAFTDVSASNLNTWRQRFKTNNKTIIYSPGMETSNVFTREVDHAGMGVALNYRTGFMNTLFKEELTGYESRLSWRHIRDWDDNFSLNKTDSDVYISISALTRGGAIKGRGFYLCALDSLKLDINTLLQQKYLAENLYVTEKDKNGDPNTYGHILHVDRLLATHRDHIAWEHDQENQMPDKLSKLYTQTDFERSPGRYSTWESLEQMWNAECFGGVETDAELWASCFDTYGMFGDLEAFSPLKIGSEKTLRQRDNTRLPVQHRFCIGDLSLDTMTVENLLDCDPDSPTYGVKGFWENDIPGTEVNGAGTALDGHMTTAIPWLDRLASSDTTIYPSDVLKEQVAANLIDYSDEDDEATHDGTASHYYGEATYCGLEKVPYINKVVLEVEVMNEAGIETQQRIDPATTFWEAAPNYVVTSFKVRDINVMNLYDEDSEIDVLASFYKIYINGRYAVDYRNVSQSTFTADKFSIAKADYSGDQGIDNDDEFCTIKPNPSSQSFQADTYAQFKVKYLAFQVLKDGNVADISGLARYQWNYDNNPLGKLYVKPTAKTQDGETYYEWPGKVVYKAVIYFTDPRCNTNIKQSGIIPSINLTFDVPEANTSAVNSLEVNTAWHTESEVAADPSLVNLVDPLSHNPGADLDAPVMTDGNYNSVVIDKDIYAVDQEEGTTLIEDGVKSNISTAYIRNGPMKTMWELGAVHRGEPFRTLNLTLHGTNGTYTSGDSRLYDEIKVGAQTLTAGKPFLGVACGGTYPHENFDALFKSILRSEPGTYDLPKELPSGTLDPTKYCLDGNSWSDMGHQIFSTTSDPINGRPRGQQAANLGYASYFTDKRKEELFGKVAHMFTSQNCYYTIISTGEEVKRMEMSTTMENKYTAWQASDPEKVPQNWIHVDNEGWYKVLGRVKILTKVKRDMVTEEITIMRQEIVNE